MGGHLSSKNEEYPAKFSEETMAEPSTDLERNFSSLICFTFMDEYSGFVAAFFVVIMLSRVRGDPNKSVNSLETGGGFGFGGGGSDVGFEDLDWLGVTAFVAPLVCSARTCKKDRAHFT